MELGVANQGRTQGVGKVRERCNCGDILQDVGDRRALGTATGAVAGPGLGAVC